MFQVDLKILMLLKIDCRAKKQTKKTNAQFIKTYIWDKIVPAIFDKTSFNKYFSDADVCKIEEKKLYVFKLYSYK